jgi:adenine-specific DNA-methyltransferase
VSQKQIKALKLQRNAKGRSLFDAQDEIDRRREQIIATSNGSRSSRDRKHSYLIRWKLA